jgi:hypothetical protein
LARLYLDANVALGLVDLLIGAGHTAASARDVGLQDAAVYLQMLAAWERGAILVTHNRRDFVEQHEAWHEWPRHWGLRGPDHPGVVAPDQCDERVYGPPLVAFLAASHPMTGQLYAWRQNTDTWQRWESGAGWRPYP